MSSQTKKHDYPLVAVKDIVVFPRMTVPVLFEKERSLLAAEEALKTDRSVILVLRKKKLGARPGLKDIYSVGVLVRIKEAYRISDKTMTLQLEGRDRVRVTAITRQRPYLRGRIEKISQVSKFSLEEDALMHNVDEYFKKCIVLGLPVPLENMSDIFSNSSPSEKLDLIAFFLDLRARKKQKILEAFSLRRRLELIYDFLRHKLEILQVAKKIEQRTVQQLGETQKKAILQEQLKAIRQELGVEDKPYLQELKKKINQARMPETAARAAKKELERLAALPVFSPELSYIRNYLEWLVDLPWSKKSKTKLNIKRAKKILDQDHYGLEEVKKRVLEYIAVCQLTEKIKGPILCFVGPPGTGKTSVGQSIARTLGREFVRISLGGIRDEAEIRGHRRTYVGALPGRIIQGIKKAGTNNPVFILDEIDKLGADFRGDPSSALLEALDPQQNSQFSDHYIEIPFDLSDVIFITTANVLDTIPFALRDRMEVVEFSGYTEEEKFQIAKKFLLPRLLESHGLKDSGIAISDRAIKEIIAGYTREAGVRDLERELASICRQMARQIVENRTKSRKKKEVTDKNLSRYLGPLKFQRAMAEKKEEVGVSIGLAVTQAGGEILFVEASKMLGEGKLQLTGQLGEVMKESGQAALSYIRSRADQLGLPENFYKKYDLHVHVPEGAIPKDGPSAGVTMAAALVSCLTGRRVKRKVGMTGEITLRGKVLEVGGIKEKILAAHRAGLTEIILPEGNKKDLAKVGEKVKRRLKFHFVKNIDQVLAIALSKK